MSKCNTCQGYGFILKTTHVDGSNIIPGGYEEKEVFDCPDCDRRIVSPEYMQTAIKMAEIDGLKDWANSSDPELPEYNPIDVSFLPTKTSQAGFGYQVLKFFTL
jgi:hypothetical protein